MLFFRSGVEYAERRGKVLGSLCNAKKHLGDVVPSRTVFTAMHFPAITSLIISTTLTLRLRKSLDYM